MCGIAGELNFRGARVEPRVLETMRDTLVHRGPDGAGLWISEDQRLGLAHRRLSIIDLSNSAGQPMSTHDGQYWIVFNGEIYNHADQRRELTSLGQTNWKTDHSDTEVLLKAYAQWGDECLQKLRGMFAFALWDVRRQRLLLARDRLGIKPLYYHLSGDRLLFASEIKAILAHPGVTKSLDETALFHYLSFLATPAPQTLFRDVRKLQAGTAVVFEAGGQHHVKRYWELWDHVQDLRGRSEDEVAQQLLAELRESVNLHKVSDVQVGVFLSGGIDSSVNAALFAEDGEAPKTFSIGYAGELKSHKNEFEYARKMAARVGAQHSELELEADDLLSFLPRMVHLQDEPIADPVCLPTYFVSKLARDAGIKVCQVGEGSDELFWGYPNWKLHLKWQKFGAWPSPLRGLALGGLKLAGYGETFTYEALRRWHAGIPAFWSGAEAFTEAQKRRLLSPRLNQDLAGLSSLDVIRPFHQTFLSKAPEPSALNWMSYMDLNLRLPELLLMRVDKMGMGVSLESRVPFLDHKFVEYAMSIPTEMKTRNGVLKHVLKRAVRGVIPDAIIDRQKQGFSVPLPDWFEQKLGQVMRDEIHSFCAQTNYLNWAECERLFAKKQPLQIWFLFNLALWWKHSFH